MNTSRNILKILLQIHLFTLISTYVIWELFESDIIIYLQWLFTAIPISIVMYIYSKSIDRYANQVQEQKCRIEELELRVSDEHE